jgi:hypothetical protein
MRPNKILSVLPIATLMLVAALPAPAQGSFGVGYTKFGKHSAWGVGFQSGPIYPHHDRVVVVERAPRRVFVPGHYETRCVEVWVPGCAERVWVEPVYRTVTVGYGNVARVLVREGGYRVIEKPGHYETQHVQIWVPGYFV